jgi:hypothetical protein
MDLTIDVDYHSNGLVDVVIPFDDEYNIVLNVSDRWLQRAIVTPEPSIRIMKGQQDVTSRFVYFGTKSNKIAPTLANLYTLTDVMEEVIRIEEHKQERKES